MFFTYPEDTKQEILQNLAGPSTASRLPSRAWLQEQLEEAQHLMDVIQHFEAYGSVSLQSAENEEQNFQFHARYQGVLAKITTLEDRFRAVRESIVANQLFLSQMLSVQDAFYSENVNYDRVRGLLGSLDPSKMSKVRSALRQLQRDWSDEGAAERAQSYGPIIEDVLRLHPLAERSSTGDMGESQTPAAPRILVPGAGLGRLPWELANMGYDAEANELSYYMLLPAFFILNCCDATRIKEYNIACNVMETTNWLRAQDRTRQVKVRTT